MAGHGVPVQGHVGTPRCKGARGACPSPHTSTSSPIGQPPERGFGILWGLHVLRHSGLSHGPLAMKATPVPLSAGRLGVGAERAHPPGSGQFPWQPAPTPRLSRGPPKIISVTDTQGPGAAPCCSPTCPLLPPVPTRPRACHLSSPCPAAPRPQVPRGPCPPCAPGPQGPQAAPAGPIEPGDVCARRAPSTRRRRRTPPRRPSGDPDGVQDRSRGVTDSGWELIRDGSTASRARTRPGSPLTKGLPWGAGCPPALAQRAPLTRSPRSSVPRPGGGGPRSPGGLGLGRLSCWGTGLGRDPPVAHVRVLSTRMSPIRVPTGVPGPRGGRWAVGAHSRQPRWRARRRRASWVSGQGPPSACGSAERRQGAAPLV